MYFFIDYTVIALLLILTVIPGDMRFLQSLFPFIAIISAFMITTIKNGEIIFFVTIMGSSMYYMKIFEISTAVFYFAKKFVPFI